MRLSGIRLQDREGNRAAIDEQAQGIAPVEMVGPGEFIAHRQAVRIGQPRLQGEGPAPDFKGAERSCS